MSNDIVQNNNQLFHIYENNSIIQNIKILAEKDPYSSHYASLEVLQMWRRLSLNQKNIIDNFFIRLFGLSFTEIININKEKEVYR